MKSSSATINSEINRFKSDVVQTMQIPFYIYSGRIVQTFNKGSGFILAVESGEELKTIKFVANSETSHDAVFSLSSGQLSALVISFMLTLNKVYSQNNLLLIDDPSQSMDDLNITGLIELLRNDFKGSNIILSTHEEHISQYMSYKFSKANIRIGRINLKDLNRS
jgi:exonuclease SbcC